MLKLVRPLNLVLVFSGVVLGAWITRLDGPVDWIWTLIAAVALALLAAAGNVHNDIVDVETDRVNRPDRPLPSGRVSLRAATVLCGSLFGASVVLGAVVSVAHAAVLGAMALLLWLYNRWLKHLPLIGNVVVAGLVTASLPFARLDGQWPSTLVVAMLFAFVLNFIREVIKDAEDTSGDGAVGSRTWAIVAGTSRVRRWVQALLVITLVAMPVPTLLPAFSGTWLLTSLPAAVFLALGLSDTVRSTFPGASTSRHVKSAMILGLVALAISVQ